MPFRLTVAEDAFKHKLDAGFSNLDFCTAIADDMIIWIEQPDGSDHEKHLIEFLQVTRKNNQKLNINKPQYKTKHASVLGTTFTYDGHKQENEKVQAINIMPQPTNVKDFQCFLGMANT